MKKILACLLTVCMLFAMMPLTAFAADDVASVTDPTGATANYATLAAALAAVKDNTATGAYTVTLLTDCAENVTVVQHNNKSITLEGDGANTVFSGTITVDGNANYNGSNTLTINNICFSTESTNHTFIYAKKSTVGKNYNYPHNVTVSNCEFYGSNASGTTVCGIVFASKSSAKNVTIKNCKSEGLYYLAQFHSTNGVTVENVEIIDSLAGGIGLYQPQNVNVTNLKVTTAGYGLMLCAGGSASRFANLTNCQIEAKNPILMRTVAKDYAINITGEDTEMIATGDNGCITEVNAEGNIVPLNLQGNVQVTADAGTYTKFNQEWCAQGYIAVKVSEEKTVVVKEGTEFTVSFSGADIPAQTVVAGNTAVKPADPAKTGCNFGGWYQDAELTVPYDFAAPVAENLTLYANWLPLYNITFETNGGSAIVDRSYVVGTVVDLTAEQLIPTRLGYVFAGWHLNKNLTDAPITSLAVTAETTLYAAWVNPDAGETEQPNWLWIMMMMQSMKYKLTAVLGEGVTTDAPLTVQVKYNTDYTYNFKVEKGYKIVDVIVDNKSVGAVAQYTFKKVTANHQITVVTEKVNPYADLDKSASYYNVVLELYNKGIMEGDGKNFNANGTLTREQMVTVLWRAAGEPAAKTAAKFTDVKAGAYYVKAVDWAFETGLMEGHGDGTFGVGEKLTRSQLCTVIYRWLKANGAGFTNDSWKNAKYADFANVADWAAEAMVYFADASILPVTANKLNPTEAAPRWLIAVMIYPLIAD